MTRRAGFSFTPCPGCNSTEGRPKDGVCQTCRADLDFAATTRAAQAAAAAAGTDALRHLPGATHHIPRVPHDLRDAGIDGSSGKIRDAFHALALTLGKPTDYTTSATPMFRLRSYADESNSYYGTARTTHYRSLPQGLADQLADLYDLVRDGMASAHAEGKADGSHLLRQLGEGAITGDEFARRNGGG